MYLRRSQSYKCSTIASYVSRVAKNRNLPRYHSTRNHNLRVLSIYRQAAFLSLWSCIMATLVESLNQKVENWSFHSNQRYNDFAIGWWPHHYWDCSLWSATCSSVRYYWHHSFCLRRFFNPESFCSIILYFVWPRRWPQGMVPRLAGDGAGYGDRRTNRQKCIGGPIL